jgi:hypothetical protein
MAVGIGLYMAFFGLMGMLNEHDQRVRIRQYGEYVDYCGKTRLKVPGMVLQDGVTPLLLDDKDVSKFQSFGNSLRLATEAEKRVFTSRMAVPPHHHLWMLDAATPQEWHALARQYECTLEPLLQRDQINADVSETNGSVLVCAIPLCNRDDQRMTDR